MNTPGIGTDGADSVKPPGWQTLAVFALLAPALVLAVSSPAMTLATIGGFVLGMVARTLPIDRVRQTVARGGALMARTVFGPSETRFETAEERLE